MKVNITYIIRKDGKTLHTFEDPEEAIEKFIAIRKQESENHEKKYLVGLVMLINHTLWLAR